MPIPSCPSCKGKVFEVIQKRPKNSTLKLDFVQCSSCGSVVGVLEHPNINVILQNHEKMLSEIQQHLSSLEIIINQLT